VENETETETEIYFTTEITLQQRVSLLFELFAKPDCQPAVG